MSRPIAIIGAGHAADALAAQLRQQGCREPILMVGEERHLPYERPPLSKAFLQGAVGAEQLALRPPGFYAAQGIEVLTATRATRIDRQHGTVELDGPDGRSTLPYRQLVLATGSKHRALRVPGAAHPQVIQLRTLDDAHGLRAALRRGGTLLIVGGGYIGLEAAACALALGARPVLVEREPRLLARVASQTLSRHLFDLHTAHGVQIHCGTQLEAIRTEGDRIVGALLADGRVLRCDAVLVGIGALANDDLAQAAGLRCADGVVVDHACRTEDERIYAIGDCARRDLAGFGTLLRLQSIPAAQEQARTVAAALLGRPPVAAGVPWFWSDQFDARLQIAGLVGTAATTFVRRAAHGGGFAVYHLDAARRLFAVEAVSSPAEFTVARSLIQLGATIPAEREQAPLAELRKSAAIPSERGTP